MPPKAPPPFVVNKKLVLHFDLDGVLMLPRNVSKDDLVRDRVTQVIQMAAENAWGKVEQKDAKSQPAWKLQAPALSKTAPPEIEGCSTYKQYLESTYPISKDASEVANQESEKVRADAYANFLKGPGSKLKGEVEKLLKSISVPKTLQEFIKSEQESKEEQSAAYKSVIGLLAGGKSQLLPAFFKLLLALKKAKREFAVVFHAEEGSPHEDLLRELNLFFAGEHPCYNGKNGTPLNKFDGSKGTKNFRIGDKNSAVLYRFDKAFSSDCATFGTRRLYKEKDIEALKHKLLESKADTKLCVASEIYSYSHVLLRESASLYYIDRLKTMIVDPVDYNTQEIYFHANNKVEVVSCLGETLENTEGKMSVRVELFELLRDVDFFIKQVEACQKNRAQEIEKTEKGVVEEEVVKPVPKDDRPLSDTEYLKQTIFPLLDGALRLVDIERPDDPIAVIALYCLKNKHRIKKPEQPKPAVPAP